MKCEECRPLLEDYLYGHLAGPAAESLVSHLAACSECEREFALLEREQAIYQGCEVKAPATVWAGVKARIAQENNSRLRRWPGLPGLFSFTPVRAFALGLLALACLAGLLRYVSRPEAAMPESAVAIRRDDLRAGAAQSTRRENATTTAQDSGLGAEQPDGQDGHIKKSSHPGYTASDRSADFKRTDRSLINRGYLRRAKREMPLEDFASIPSPALLGHREAASDLDAETARHIERAEILLRSFKNERLSPDESTLDLNYERRLSRELLARNILLRRDADARGHAPLARLLDHLEPFLLDIANLRDNSDREDVRLVKERVAREQIIVALQTF